MFREVIVGVDHHDGGRDAIALATRLLGPHRQLTLVHVSAGDVSGYRSGSAASEASERRHDPELLRQARAEAGVRAAVSSPGDSARAEPASQAFLAANAGSHLHQTSVSVTTDGVLVTVTVTGTPPSLIPGGTGALTRTASGPLELLGQGAAP